MKTVLKVVLWPIVMLAKLTWWIIKLNFIMLKVVVACCLLAFISTDV